MTVFERQTHSKSPSNVFSHSNQRVDAPASFEYFEIISKLFCHGQLWQSIQYQMMDSQTSGPKTFAQLHPEYILPDKLEACTKASDQNQSHSLIALWQHHGCKDDQIFNDLEVIFPYHGHPLSW
jgi:hypothetical protein